MNPLHQTLPPPLVSVIIVAYNSGALLVDCVRQVLNSALPVEVIVSDNASCDGAVEALLPVAAADPRLRLLRHADNRGFAVGCNRALADSRGEFVLFLNPDCIVSADTLPQMVATLRQHPKAGMAGCLIRNADGSMQSGCRRSMPTPWRVGRAYLQALLGKKKSGGGHFAAADPMPAEPHEVEAISGAFMLLRRSVLDQTGSFDEGYFLHWEDLDLCLRLGRSGHSILFVPGVAVLHLKGHSSQVQSARVEWHKNCGLLRFFRRHYFTGLLAPLLLALWPLVGLRWLTHQLLARRRARRQSSAEAARLPAVQDVASRPEIWVIGATSPVGAHLLPRLVAAGYRVHAFSRQPDQRPVQDCLSVSWHRLDLQQPHFPALAAPDAVICLAPLVQLPPALDALAGRGIKRLIVFSSTSVITKRDSPLPEERELARQLAAGEDAVRQIGTDHGIPWVVLRPTLVYAWGRDRNIMRLAEFIARFGFLPLPGDGHGLRQPVHAGDLAQACLDLLVTPTAWNAAYALSGSEVLSYRQLVSRIFDKLGRRPRILCIPMAAWQPLIAIARRLPGYGFVNMAMVRRVDADMTFDHQDARDRFGFAPRAFRL